PDPTAPPARGAASHGSRAAPHRNLKPPPKIEGSATPGAEAGSGEPVCPSRNLTTTPRQRIALRREMARQPPGSPLQRALLEESEYDSVDTCAADGSCRLACPLGIDTRRLVQGPRPGRPTRPAGAPSPPAG